MVRTDTWNMFMLLSPSDKICEYFTQITVDIITLEFDLLHTAGTSYIMLIQYSLAHISILELGRLFSLVTW